MKWIGWYWREAKERIKRDMGLIKFAAKMMLKPKGTIFTCNGEVVNRIEYIKGLLPLMKRM